MRRLSLLLLLINVFSLFGIEYTVKQDGSGDYTTIQSAVNSAQSGDGILVYPGTYYENIIINEKNIDLYSLKHTTDDDSYIYQTTINGQDSLSCISIVHNCNVLIDGFSITNGNGWGSGFSDDYDYQGGGIKIDFDNQVEVNNCRIFSNQAMTGGGIFTRGYLTISNNSIFNNRGLSGGGIFIDNYGEADMNMSSTNRNSIYNNKAGNGLDIMYYAPSSNYTNTMSVYLDTFSVAEPDNYFITYQISNLSYTHNHNPFTIIDIEHGYRELINQDFYVSPQGDDNNSGLTPDDPLLSIYKAFTSIKSDSLNPKTVYLAEGEYSNIDGGEQIFPIPLKKHVNFQGANRENTVIYNESNYTGLKSNLFYENSTISNFTLTSITHNSSGFMLFTYKDVTVDNIIFENSVARVFTGFATIPSDYDFTIRNCIIRNNIATEYAAGLTIYYGNDLLIESCIIENNYSYLNEWCNNTCNGIYLLGGENLLMRKCIVRDNYVTYPMDWGMLGISGSLRYSQEH
ncbi:MAG: right-handed parallel beta-helix repeat-containing protein, partial [Candidatus Cloacimonadota bacterium]|nr:right-handed parallel beta-helix repeat-containing protein [Candidatus Cloacimonadota bacterium]